MSSNLFDPLENKNTDPERERVIILVSDGAPSAGSLDPSIAAGYAAEQ